MPTPTDFSVARNAFRALADEFADTGFGPSFFGQVWRVQRPMRGGTFAPIVDDAMADYEHDCAVIAEHLYAAAQECTDRMVATSICQFNWGQYNEAFDAYEVAWDAWMAGEGGEEPTPPVPPDDPEPWMDFYE